MLFLTAVDLVIIALLPPEHRRVSLEIRHRPEETALTPQIINHKS